MNLKENYRRSKEVLGATFRQGFKELGSIFYGPGTAAQPAEYGMIHTKTPGEVADGMRGKVPSAPDQNARTESMVDQYLRDSRDAQERSSREAQEHGGPAKHEPPAMERE